MELFESLDSNLDDICHTLDWIFERIPLRWTSSAFQTVCWGRWAARYNDFSKGILGLQVNCAMVLPRSQINIVLYLCRLYPFLSLPYSHFPSALQCSYRPPSPDLMVTCSSQLTPELGSSWDSGNWIAMYNPSSVWGIWWVNRKHCSTSSWRCVPVHVAGYVRVWPVAIHRNLAKCLKRY